MEYNGKTVDSFKKHLKNSHAKIIVVLKNFWRHTFLNKRFINNFICR